MARKYARDAKGQFASTGGAKPRESTAKKTSKPKRSPAKNAALVAGAVLGAGAAAGVLKVRSDALGRYDARLAASALRAANSRSSW